MKNNEEKEIEKQLEPVSRNFAVLSLNSRLWQGVTGRKGRGVLYLMS